MFTIRVLLGPVMKKNLFQVQIAIFLYLHIVKREKELFGIHF